MAKKQKKLPVLTSDNLTDLTNILDEVYEAYFDIPFGNSRFQTEAFVVSEQITPERAYRTIGLQLQSVLLSIKEHEFNRELSTLKKEESIEKLKNEQLSPYEKRKLEIDLEKMEYEWRECEKLINDKIHEANVLYKHFKSLPKFTRNQFENGERRHFVERLVRQAKSLSGSQTALINMHDDMVCLDKYVKKFSQLEDKYTDEDLLKLAESTLNNTSNNFLSNETTSKLEKPKK